MPQDDEMKKKHSEPLPIERPNPPKGETWGKEYDCGCKAYGGKDLPDYCPEHGTPPTEPPKREEPSAPDTAGADDPPPQVPPGG